MECKPVSVSFVFVYEYLVLLCLALCCLPFNFEATNALCIVYFSPVFNYVSSG